MAISSRAVTDMLKGIGFFAVIFGAMCGATEDLRIPLVIMLSGAILMIAGEIGEDDV